MDEKYKSAETNLYSTTTCNTHHYSHMCNPKSKKVALSPTAHSVDTELQVELEDLKFLVFTAFIHFIAIVLHHCIYHVIKLGNHSYTPHISSTDQAICL